MRLPSESKTSGGSVVRALPARFSFLCARAAHSQHLSLFLSRLTKGHHFHLHVCKWKNTHLLAHDILYGQRLEQHTHVQITNTPRSKTHVTWAQMLPLPA